MLNLAEVNTECDAQRPCGQHLDTHVEVLCKDCQEMCCVLCALSGKHKSHDCVEIIEAAREFKTSLKPKMAAVCQASENISKLLKYKQDSFIAASKKFSQCLDDVDKRVAKIHSQVDAYHNQLRYEIQMKQREYEESLYQIAKHADSYQETLKNYKQICEKQDEAIVEMFTKEKHQVDELLQNVNDLSMSDLSFQMEWKFNEDISKIMALFEDIIINGKTISNINSATLLDDKLSRDGSKGGMTSFGASESAAVTSEKVEKIDFKYELEKEMQFDSPLKCLAYCPDGQLIVGKATGVNTTSVDVYTPSGLHIRQICTSDLGLCDVALNDNAVFVSNNISGKVFIYDLVTGSLSKTLTLHTKGDNGLSINGEQLYVTSCDEHLVYKINMASGYTKEIFVGVQNPYMVSARGDYVAVSCTWQHKVHVLDKRGSPLFVFGSDRYGSRDGELARPCGVCYDPQQRLYIADFFNKRIVVVASSGALLTHIALLMHPFHLTIDASCRLYAMYNNELQVIKYHT